MIAYKLFLAKLTLCNQGRWEPKFTAVQSSSRFSMGWSLYVFCCACVVCRCMCWWPSHVFTHVAFMNTLVSRDAVANIGKQHCAHFGLTTCATLRAPCSREFRNHTNHNKILTQLWFLAYLFIRILNNSTCDLWTWFASIRFVWNHNLLILIFSLSSTLFK